MPTADRKQYNGIRMVTNHGLKTLFAPLLPDPTNSPWVSEDDLSV